MSVDDEKKDEPHQRIFRNIFIPEFASFMGFGELHRETMEIIGARARAHQAQRGLFRSLVARLALAVRQTDIQVLKKSGQGQQGGCQEGGRARSSDGAARDLVRAGRGFAPLSERWERGRRAEAAAVCAHRPGARVVAPLPKHVRGDQPYTPPKIRKAAGLRIEDPRWKAGGYEREARTSQNTEHGHEHLWNRSPRINALNHTPTGVLHLLPVSLPGLLPPPLPPWRKSEHTALSEDSRPSCRARSSIAEAEVWGLVGGNAGRVGARDCPWSKACRSAARRSRGRQRHPRWSWSGQSLVSTINQST